MLRLDFVGVSPIPAQIQDIACSGCSSVDASGYNYTFDSYTPRILNEPAISSWFHVSSDDLIEQTESFDLNASEVTGYGVEISPEVLHFNIVDETSLNRLYVKWETNEVSMLEGDPAVEVALVFPQDIPTFDVVPIAIEVISQSAHAEDYTVTHLSPAEFYANGYKVSIAANADNVAEPVETFVVRLLDQQSTYGNADTYRVIEPRDIVVTIEQDIRVELDLQTDYEFDEGVGIVEIPFHIVGEVSPELLPYVITLEAENISTETYDYGAGEISNSDFYLLSEGFQFASSGEGETAYLRFEVQDDFFQEGDDVNGG